MRRLFFLRLAALAGVIGFCLAAVGDAQAVPFHRGRDRPGVLRRAGRLGALVLPPWASTHRGCRHRCRSCD